ncbi:MAG: hypothetical protein J3R72DRAFT_250897 [Linnemannia gamsii]|nr:MAG: hypothetical protein J3R72DRAFT_250897 [Linnemannia gamsii]
MFHFFFFFFFFFPLLSLSILPCVVCCVSVRSAIFHCCLFSFFSSCPPSFAFSFFSFTSLHVLLWSDCSLISFLLSSFVTFSPPTLLLFRSTLPSFLSSFFTPSLLHSHVLTPLFPLLDQRQQTPFIHPSLPSFSFRQVS